MKKRNYLNFFNRSSKSGSHLKYVFFVALIFSLLNSFTFNRNIQKEVTKPLHILIVTGMDIPAHDWRETSKALKEVLDKCKNQKIKIDVLENPYELESIELSRYEVVLLNFNNWEKPDPNDKAKESLERFVSEGGGLVLIHFASGAFGDWAEFPKLAGKVWDRKNTHDPRGKFLVETVDTVHPITRDMKSYQTDDELYICLTGNQPVQILAEARSKVTGRYHPMAFVLNYGKGRVFHTTLGHDARAIQISGTAALICRGVEWVAKQSIYSE